MHIVLKIIISLGIILTGIVNKERLVILETPEKNLHTDEIQLQSLFLYL